MNKKPLESILADEYSRRGVPADRLPYSPDFDAILEAVCRRAGVGLAPAEFWKLILSMRKTGMLPRVGR